MGHQMRSLVTVVTFEKRQRWLAREATHYLYKWTPRPCLMRQSSLLQIGGFSTCRGVGSHQCERHRMASSGSVNGLSRLLPTFPCATLSSMLYASPRSSPFVLPSFNPNYQLNRHASSAAALLQCPEFNPTVWGLSGLFLTSFHSIGLPYWACMSLTNIVVRTSILPIFIQGVRTSANFAKVAPEVQYLVSSFQRDFHQLRRKGDVQSQLMLLRMTLQTLQGIFKLHKVNLFDIFKSPLLQIPIFWYFSIDIRKIIHGSDPALAQSLTESNFLWMSDLTEPDPWYGLPILTGVFLYGNVELATGRRALSGETSSKSHIAKMLKDFFQSLAIFMPCFMAQQPSGVQIYLATSMLFSLAQSTAMRNDSVRQYLGIPLLNASAPSDQGMFVREFMEHMKLREEARQRGELMLGEGVLKIGAAPARSGRARKSSISVTNDNYEDENPSESSFDMDSEIMKELTPLQSPSLLVNLEQLRPSTPFLPMTSPQILSPSTPSVTSLKQDAPHYLTEITDSVMDAANRGERLSKVVPSKFQQKNINNTTSKDVQASFVAKRSRSKQKISKRRNKRK